MPCFLTQRIELDLTKVDAKFVLESLRGLQSENLVVDAKYALVSLRYGESVLYRDGKLTITAQSQERTAEIEKEVKRGISNVVVQAASKKFRWTITKGARENEYVAQKRGF